MSTVNLTRRELDVMGVLWKRGPSTVAQIREDLNADADLEVAYNTVQTIVRIMQRKRLVNLATSAQAYRYEANVDRGEAAWSAVMDLVNSYFDGRLDSLMESLVLDPRFGPVVLRRFRQILDQRIRREYLKALP